MGFCRGFLINVTRLASVCVFVRACVSTCQCVCVCVWKICINNAFLYFFILLHLLVDTKDVDGCYMKNLYICTRLYNISMYILRTLWLCVCVLWKGKLKKENLCKRKRLWYNYVYCARRVKLLMSFFIFYYLFYPYSDGKIFYIFLLL